MTGVTGCMRALNPATTLDNWIPSGHFHRRPGRANDGRYRDINRRNEPRAGGTVDSPRLGKQLQA